MRYIILISLIILTGSFSLTQESLIERYNIFNAEISVVDELPDRCDHDGCTLIYRNGDLIIKKEIYIDKNTKDFEDVLAHELLHYYLPTFSEDKIIKLTPKFKEYINK